MTDAGFFKGTTADQDNRFSDKKKKLMKSMKFNDGLEKKVDMSKVNVDTIKPWIAQRITELLGIEDDVLVEFVYNQLEPRFPDPKDMQINLTGFLNPKNARVFLGELWEHLCSAQDNIGGIPAKFVEQKKEEIKRKKAEQERIQANLKKHEEQIRETLREQEEKEKRSRRRSRSKSKSPKRKWESSPDKSPKKEKSPSPDPKSKSPTKTEEPVPEVKTKFIDDGNSEMTEFIKRSVQGIAHDENMDVINAAVKRYFTSQKEAENRQKKNMNGCTQKGNLSEK